MAPALALIALLWWGYDTIRRDKECELELRTKQGAATEFCISRQYLASFDRPYGYKLVAIDLIVYLPGLLPKWDAEKAGYQMFVVNSRGLKLPADNEVVIKLSPSSSGGVEREFHDLIDKRGVRFDGIRDNAFEVYTITKENASGTFLPNPDRGEYLRPLGRDDAFIQCTNLQMAPADTRCSIHTQFSSKLALLITFTRSRLADWASMEAKVKKLVASFIVANGQPQSR